MSNIEKIRQEIERRKKRWLYYDLPIAIGRYYEDRDILAFIDSLPEDDPLNDPKFCEGFDVGRKVQKIFDEPEDDIPKIKGWIARNKDGSLVFCYHKPHRENSITQEWWGSCDADFRIYDDTIDEQFKDLKWEDEPREVELIIKCGTCKESLQVQETCKENQDSFTDEPKEMSVDEAMKYIDEKIAKARASKSWEGVDIDKFLDDLRGREPEELKKAAEEYEDWVESYSQADFPTCVSFKQAFIAGAKWMESQMPMPEDTVIFMKGVAEGRRLEREDRNNDNLPRFYGD